MVTRSPMDVRDFWINLHYDDDVYDKIPTYEWNSKIRLADFSRMIENDNDETFETLKRAICAKLPGLNEPIPNHQCK